MLKVCETIIRFSIDSDYFKGLLDYEAAQKLSPDDTKIREDAQRIRNYLEINQDFS